MKSNEIQPQEVNPEKILSKVEIDLQIQEIENNINSSTTQRNDLSEFLKKLIHSYESSGKTLESFKKAKEVLEERIENKTLPDKLVDAFKILTGGKAIAEKSEFIEYSPLSTVSRDYNQVSSDIRDSVSELAENKDTIRELMGEDLSFRGGKIEGEDETAREQSISKITDRIKDTDSKIGTLEISLKDKRTASYEAWKIENPEEWAKVQKDEKSAQAFEELLASKPTEEELNTVYHRTDSVLVKEKARNLLLDLAKSKGKRAVFDFLSEEDNYRPENFDLLTSVQSSNIYSRRNWDNKGRVSLSETQAWGVLKLLDFSDPKVVEFALSKLSADCSSIGHGSSCINGGCCMVENYFHLPINIKKKIIDKLEAANRHEVARLFADVEAAEITDPLEKANFILSLGYTRRYRYDSDSTPIDSISPEDRRKAAETYLGSGDIQDGEKLKVAMSFLGNSAEDLALLEIFLNDPKSKIAYSTRLSYFINKMPSGTNYVNLIDLKEVESGISNQTLKSRTLDEAQKEIKFMTDSIMESFGFSKYTYRDENKSSQARDLILSLVDKHLNTQLELIKQKEAERKEMMNKAI